MRRCNAPINFAPFSLEFIGLENTESKGFLIDISHIYSFKYIFALTYFQNNGTLFLSTKRGKYE